MLESKVEFWEELKVIEESLLGRGDRDQRQKNESGDCILFMLFSTGFSTYYPEIGQE